MADPDKFTVDYHPPDTPWPSGITCVVFDDCHSKIDALNRFIELKGEDLAEHIIEVRPLEAGPVFSREEQLPDPADIAINWL